MRAVTIGRALLLWIAGVIAVSGCNGYVGDPDGPRPDPRDAGSAERRDGGRAALEDAGTAPPPAMDGGLDAGLLDAGVDAGAPDAGVDAGLSDAGPPPDPGMPDLSTVRWLHTNVSSWPATAQLRSVTFRSGQICMDYDRADVWPIVHTAGADVVGNPWVFIERDGVWYGATWEWLRPGQHCKAMTSVAGDHIKQAPFDAASGWRPTSGQVLWFMVSGLARSSERNTMERTNLVRVVWP